jgi:hypothetical protein
MFIASLLGIPHLLVAVNKMDLVKYSEERYTETVYRLPGTNCSNLFCLWAPPAPAGCRAGLCAGSVRAGPHGSGPGSDRRRPPAFGAAPIPGAGI